MDDEENKPVEPPKDVIVYHYNEDQLSKEIIEMINNLFNGVGFQKVTYPETKTYDNNVIQVDFNKNKSKKDE